MIQLKNISFKYNEENHIFTNFNLNFPENKFISIIGENGSGKSTLAKLLAAILLPDSGKIFIDDFDTGDYDNLINIRKKAALIMSNPDWQLIGSTVSEEIASGLYKLNVTKSKNNQRDKEIVDLIGIDDL